MTTTPAVTALPVRNASKLVAQEIRAELARQGRSIRSLSRQMVRTHTWLSARLSPTAKVDLTVDEIAEIAEALGVPVQGLLGVWLESTLVRSYGLAPVADVIELAAWKVAS